MKRRHFLSSLGAAGPLLLVGGCAKPDRSEGTADPDAFAFDLSGIEAIDTHVHPPAPMTLSESYDKWNSSFVNAMLPGYEYDGKAALRDKLEDRFEEHLYSMPRQTGYYNYVAKAYGVAPDTESFDQVVSAGIQRGFTPYIKSILDRENISSVVLESREARPQRPDSAIPADRFVWTCPIVDLIQPGWASTKGLSSADAVRRAIYEFMEESVTNGCRGFKSSIAYYRPLGVDMVSDKMASEALRELLDNPPSQNVPGRNVPDYQTAELKTAFRNYQDHLLRHIFIKAGELKAPVVIHTAVALHPALRFEFNSPVELHHIFLDDEIKRVETQFVLIHTGYPYHDHVAAMLSQFPNVYTDVSFYSKFPGVLEETLRAFLALAPSEKVMHGSDSNNVPEEIGYCAWNTRHVLGRVLTDYQAHYGWSRRDCEVIANNVLHENARRVFKI
ncbi:MAG: amidohydrolase family protein [Woeseia sp.]